MGSVILANQIESGVCSGKKWILLLYAVELFWGSFFKFEIKSMELQWYLHVLYLALYRGVFSTRDSQKAAVTKDEKRKDILFHYSQD